MPPGERIEIMDGNGEHHVARIDDTVTSAILHDRAEAVAVPDFNHVEQTVEVIVVGITGRRTAARARRRRRAVPEIGTSTGVGQERQ